MEWDWKEFAWDPSGLELANPTSVDLRLGESSDFVGKTEQIKEKDEQKDSKAVSSLVSVSPSSSKRSRLDNGSQNLSCLVDGCSSDLSDCREYHRRHRVCEKHSKTPVVLVAGKQQRFCQQCSRFHSLGEFDEVKRSCRKRLDGHNRRRRKPQPPSFLMTAEKFMCNYKGPRILHFGNPQAYVNPVVRNMWPTSASKSGAQTNYDHHRFLYRIDKHRQDKELLLWQDNSPKAEKANNEAIMHGTPIYQPICGTIAPSSTSGKCSRLKPPSDGKPVSFDSGCALYLLSNLQTQTSELSLVQSSITYPIAQSSSGGSTVQFDAADEFSCSDKAKDKPNSNTNNGPLLVFDANTTNLHCNGMLQMGSDGLVENGDSILTLPFFWE